MENITEQLQSIIPASTRSIFSKYISDLGLFHICPIQIENDLPLLHDWINKEYAQYWGMAGMSVEELKAAYLSIMSQSNVFIGYLNEKKVFLLECYDPNKDLIGKYYESKQGDYGMHILVGPPEVKIQNFTWNVFTLIMDYIFSNPEVKRVIVEPDIRNNKIHVLNKKAGFEYQKIIQLPHKTAHLAFCTKEQYQRALAKNRCEIYLTSSEDKSTFHLQKEIWAKVNRQHLCKAISEFSHELLLKPELLLKDGKWNKYRLASTSSNSEYHFNAKKLALDHWFINPESIIKYEDGKIMPLDSISFILEFNDQLNIPEAMLPVYLEEITSTLYGASYMLWKNNLISEELVHADYQAIEHAMTAGHPCFVANNGRIGFDTDDYQKYAPEADQPIHLIWAAGHKSRATYTGISDVSYDSLLRQELDLSSLARFNNILEQKGLKHSDYFFIPIHPWQWSNKLSYIFASDIATNNLVYLGHSTDKYLAQQSIRTFYNISHPSKFYVKTALSILNMGFMRGLSPYYMGSTPAITQWMKENIGKDSYLLQTGFTMLFEVATVGYRNLNFETLGKSNAYNKMFSALWRESPSAVMRENQQIMTMAGLLHIDQNNKSLLKELIINSGLNTKEWIEKYLFCYFSPLLHCFYQHELVFMPHGENIILVMENHIPVKIIMKDITEEVMIFNPNIELPEKVKRIYVPTPEDVKLLSIFTDVFDCFFRFLGQVLVEHCDYLEEIFWEQVAECANNYQESNPHLKEKFERYDLFAHEFTRSCLNRLQLKNNQQMLDLSDPVKSLQFIGTLKNPIAIYKKEISMQNS